MEAKIGCKQIGEETYSGGLQTIPKVLSYTDDWLANII